MNTSVKFDKTKYKGVWTPNTYYDANDMVFYNGALWLANSAFTSGATFDELNWTCPNCVAEPDVELPVQTGMLFCIAMAKLVNGYVGPCLRLRRLSDSSEQDIYFGSDGYIDQLSMNAFLNGSDGVVTVWYDQSGLGNNAVKPTSFTPDDPVPITQAGVINLTNGIPSLLSSPVSTSNLTVIENWGEPTGSCFLVAKNTFDNSAMLSNVGNLSYTGLSDSGSGASHSTPPTLVNIDNVPIGNTRADMYASTMDKHVTMSFVRGLPNYTTLNYVTDNEFKGVNNRHAIVYYNSDLGEPDSTNTVNKLTDVFIN